MPEYNEENTKGGKVGVAARKAVNSPAYRGLSNALMGGAYRKIGAAFEGGGYTPRGQRPDKSYEDYWTAKAEQTQKLLEHRWHQNEFSNFRKNHYDQYQEDMQRIGDTAGQMVRAVQDGKILDANTGELIGEIDMSTPEGKMQSVRLQGEIESDAMSQITEKQIGLNNVAAEKYSNNPIVDNMISQMMQSQMKMLASQFNPQGTMAGAKNRQGLEAGQADIDYKKSLTRQADASTAQTEGKYNNADAVVRNKGPAEAARFFRNDIRGKAVLESSDYNGFLQKQLTERTAEFIRSKKWTPDEAANDVNQETTQRWLASQGPAMEERAMYEWFKREWGEDAAVAAAEGRPNMKPQPAPAFKYDITTNPDKKKTEELTDKTATLAVERGNEKMRRDGLTKPEATAWMNDEWLPAALEGRDILEGGAMTEQLKGLTVDEMNKQAAPYLKAVREAVAAAAKWLATGPDTGGLSLEQKGKPPQRRTRGAGLSRVTSAIGGLFGDGSDEYPSDFREKFPEKKPKE